VVNWNSALYIAIGNFFVSLIILFVVGRFYLAMKNEKAEVWRQMAFWMVQMSMFILFSSFFFIILAGADLGRLFSQAMGLIVSVILVAATYVNWKFVNHAAKGVEEAIVKLSQEVDLDTTTLVLLAPESWTRGPAQSKVDRAESELSSPEE